MEFIRFPDAVLVALGPELLLLGVERVAPEVADADALLLVAAALTVHLGGERLHVGVLVRLAELVDRGHVVAEVGAQLQLVLGDRIGLETSMQTLIALKCANRQKSQKHEPSIDLTFSASGYRCIKEMGRSIRALHRVCWQCVRIDPVNGLECQTGVRTKR